MKTNGILGTICVLLVILLSYMSERYNEKKIEAERLENTVDNCFQKMEGLQIQLDDTTAVMAARVSDLEYTKNNMEIRYDSLLRVCNLRAKDTRHITEVGSCIHDRIVEIPVFYDNFGGLKTEYKDNYTHISVNIDSTRLATIDYDIKDSLIIINTQKQHKLLFGLIKWKESLKTTVLSTNPKMKITAVTSVNKIE